VRVELGARAIVVPEFDTLWHLPDEPTPDSGRTETVCGLAGYEYAYQGPIRRRRSCSVCRRENRYRHVTAETA